MELFISHCERDAYIATPLTQLIIKAYNIPLNKVIYTSLPEFKPSPGSDYMSELLYNATKANIFIYLCTPMSVKSKATQKELKARKKCSRCILPVVINQTGIDLLDKSINNLEAINLCNSKEIISLLDDIKNYTNLSQQNLKYYIEDVISLTKLANSYYKIKNYKIENNKNSSQKPICYSQQVKLMLKDSYKELGSNAINRSLAYLKVTVYYFSREDGKLFLKSYGDNYFKDDDVIEQLKKDFKINEIKKI